MYVDAILSQLAVALRALLVLIQLIVAGAPQDNSEAAGDFSAAFQTWATTHSTVSSLTRTAALGDDGHVLRQPAPNAHQAPR